jgi:hypothetical protein
MHTFFDTILLIPTGNEDRHLHGRQSSAPFSGMRRPPLRLHEEIHNHGFSIACVRPAQLVQNSEELNASPQICTVAKIPGCKDLGRFRPERG